MTIAIATKRAYLMLGTYISIATMGLTDAEEIQCSMDTRQSKSHIQSGGQEDRAHSARMS